MHPTALAPLCLLPTTATAAAQLGQFRTAPNTAWSGGTGTSVGGGDLEPDGDIDVVTVTDDHATIGTNDGTGTFTDSPGSVPNGSSSGLVVVDVEPDGDLDLVTLFGNGAGTLLRNDGHGVFALAPNSDWASPRDQGICAAEFDGDGRTDLYFGASLSNGVLMLQPSPGQWVNASGTHLPALPDASVEASIATGDVDGDGDIDMYAVCNLILLPASDRLYLNRGDGSFTLAAAPRVATSPRVSSRVQLADIDGDDDLDVLCATLLPTATQPLVLNHHRQVSITTAAVRGAPLTVRFDVRPGHAPAFGVAIPIVGVRAAPVAIPSFGTWWLAPAPSIQLPPVYVPTTVGTTSHSWTLPDDPTLAGVEVGFQAGVLDPLGPPQLTNATFEVIQ